MVAIVRGHAVAPVLALGGCDIIDQAKPDLDGVARVVRQRGGDIAAIETVDHVVAPDDLTRIFDGATALCGLLRRRGARTGAVADDGACDSTCCGGRTIAATVADLIAEDAAGNGADAG